MGYGTRAFLAPLRVLIGVFLVALGLSTSSCASGPREGKPDATTGPSPAAEAAPAAAELPPVSPSGRVLVVYYSQGNAARRVAQDIAGLLGADLEEIRETKPRTGFFGYAGAGARATFKMSSRIEPQVRDPAAYDAVYVLTPVWSWSLSPPVRAWLKAKAGKLRSAAFVTVSGDTRPDGIARDMARTARVEPFVVQGFSERDFYPENRGTYLAKVAALVAPLRVAPGN